VHRLYLCLSCTVMLFMLSSFSNAEMARMEIHPLTSETLTSREFLTGAKSTKPAMIAGELRIPATSRDRLPAVVLLHGAGGVGTNVVEWAQFLNEMGVATFVLDSFTGRTIKSLRDNRAQLSGLVGIIDAYRSLQLLAAHPRIDPKRIAVMGFSRGGFGALYAAMKRFQQMHGSAGGSEFAAYIVFYPDCSLSFIGDDEVSDRPIRIFHGSADDWTSITPCRAYVDRLHAKNVDIRLTEYPHAHHGFDASALKNPLKLPRAQTTRNCSREETADGTIINSSTKQPSSPSDPCIERGTTIAYDPAAAADARQKVKEILLEVLKP